MSRILRKIIFVAMAICLCPLCAQAVPVIISTNGTITLGGTNYYQGNLVRIDDPTNPNTSASLYNAVVGNARNLDAACVQNDGKILFSITGSNYTWNGLTFYNGDVVRYNPANSVTELYLKGSTSQPGTDIFGHTTSIWKGSSGSPVTSDTDAVHLLPNGHVLLSGGDATNYMEYIGGGLLSFQDEDIVEYDPVAKKAVGVFFDATPYYTVNTTGFSILSSHEVLVAIGASATIKGTAFTKQQVIKIDTTAQTATLFMDDLGSPISAIHVIPEPATILLLGIGSLVVLKRRK